MKTRLTGVRIVAVDLGARAPHVARDTMVTPLQLPLPDPLPPFPPETYNRLEF